MSGAEAPVVLGVISSIIAIIEGLSTVRDAATNAKGLPEAFREVSNRLPMVTDILSRIKERFKEDSADTRSYEASETVLKDCEEKVKSLDDIFRKAIPAHGSSGVRRYLKAIQLYGKGHKVEVLMKGILEDMQLLMSEQGFDTATAAEQEQIIKALEDISVVESSVPDHELQEMAFVNSTYGPGTQNNARGEYIAQGNARQYISGGGAMRFGRD